MSRLAIAVRVWDVAPDPRNPARVALEGIARMKQFFAELGLATSLAGAKIDAARFPEMARNAEKRGSIKQLDEKDVQSILEGALA